MILQEIIILLRALIYNVIAEAFSNRDKFTALFVNAEHIALFAA